MANSATVGMLRVVLNADTAAFDTAMGKSAKKVDDFGKELTRAQQNLVKALGGDALIKKANDIQVAFSQLATKGIKLTADEAAKLVPTIDKAIAKLDALGKGSTSEANALRQTQAALKGIADQSKTTGDTLGTVTSRVKETALGFVTGMVSLQAFERAGRAAFDFVKDSIGQALEAEKVQRQLTAALVAQGLAIPQVSTYFDALSKKYERLTINSDEAIKTTETLLIQVGGVLPHQMDQALRAVTDLSAGMGVDLRSATMLVAKAFEDNFASLKKAGIQIDEAKAKAEGMSYVLGQIEKRFGGQAQAEASSYEGRVQQLGNRFDDLKESIGGVALALASMKTTLLGIDIIMAGVDAALKTEVARMAALATFAGQFDPTGTLAETGRNLTDLLVSMATETSRLDKAMAANAHLLASSHGNTGVFSDADKMTLHIMAMKLADEQAAIAKKKHEEAAKKLADELARLEEHYQKITKEAMRGYSDAEQQQINDDIEVFKRSGIVRDGLKLRIGTTEELIRTLDKLHKTELTLANAPPVFNVPFGSSGMQPGPSVKLGPAPVDVTNLEKWSRGLGFATTITAQFGKSNSIAWRYVDAGIQTAMSSLGKYTEVLKTKDKQAALSAAGSSLAMSAATMGIGALISLIGGWVQQARAQAQAIADLNKQLTEMGYSADEVAIQLQAMWDAAPDTRHPGIVRVDNLNKVLDEAKKLAADVTASITKMTAAAAAFGGVAPNALRPFIQDLLKSVKLTQDQRAALEGLLAKPKWQDIQQQAEGLGVSLDALGSGFQQSKLNDLADGYNSFFTTAIDMGGDAGGILAGMSDEIQGLIDNARKFSLKLPEFLKPMLEQMAKAGLLLDANGNKMADLSGFEFTSVESSFDRMADYLKEIRDLLAQAIPQAAEKAGDALGKAFPRHGAPDLSSGGGGGGVQMPGMDGATYGNWVGVGSSTSAPNVGGGNVVYNVSTIDIKGFEDFLNSGGNRAVMRTLPVAVTNATLGRR